MLAKVDTSSQKWTYLVHIGEAAVGKVDEVGVARRDQLRARLLVRLLPTHTERESLLNLSRRTVNFRRPERARNEGSTGPKGL